MNIYENRFHSGHLYLHIEDHEAKDIQVSRFEELIDKYNKPLQIITPSNSDQLISLLDEAGFLLKRKCYEMHVGVSDLNYPMPNHLPKIIDTQKGMQDYTKCADMMYHYYCDTHFPINPMTASISEFYELLPDVAVYSVVDDMINAAAFIEENEIAYVCSYNRRGFSEFAQSLLSYMFSNYERIFFEADDTDWAATQLRAMFSVANIFSYNTYVKSR